MLSHRLRGCPEEDHWHLWAKQDGQAENECLLASAVVAMIIPVWILGHKSVCGCKDTSVAPALSQCSELFFYSWGCLFHQLAQKLTLWLPVSAPGYLRANPFNFRGSYSHSVLARNRTMSVLFEAGPDSLSSAWCAKPFPRERASLLFLPELQVSIPLAVLQRAERSLQLRQEFRVFLNLL